MLCDSSPLIYKLRFHPCVLSENKRTKDLQGQSQRTQRHLRGMLWSNRGQFEHDDWNGLNILNM